MHGSRQANRHGCFFDGWVSLAVDPGSPCVFTRGMERLDLPVRHGEGRLLAPPDVLEHALERRLVPLRYADPKSGQPTDRFPHNPNGSADNIAGLCDESGRLFGLMPHPEAFLYPECHPAWRRRELTGDGGLAIFENAVRFAAQNGG